MLMISLPGNSRCCCCFLIGLTAAGHVNVEREAILGLVGQQWLEALQVLVAALGHRRERHRAVRDVGEVLRAEGGERKCLKRLSIWKSNHIK